MGRLIGNEQRRSVDLAQASRIATTQVQSEPQRAVSVFGRHSVCVLEVWPSQAASESNSESNLPVCSPVRAFAGDSGWIASLLTLRG